MPPGVGYPVDEKRREQLFARKRISLVPWERDYVQDVLRPAFNPAIKRAENNPRNFGVLSEQVDSPEQANSILNNSLMNAYTRWIQAGQPGDFLTFFRDRWAPLGADNDPNNLNKNFEPNVRNIIQQNVPRDTFREFGRRNVINTVGSESESLLNQQ